MSAIKTKKRNLTTLIIFTTFFISTANALNFYTYDTLGQPFNFIIEVNGNDSLSAKQEYRTNSSYKITANKHSPRAKKNTPRIITTADQIVDVAEQLSARPKVVTNKSSRSTTQSVITRYCNPTPYLRGIFSYLSSWGIKIEYFADKLTKPDQIMNNIVARFERLSKTVIARYSLQILDLVKRSATYKVTLPNQDSGTTNIWLAKLSEKADDLTITLLSKRSNKSNSDRKHFINDEEVPDGVESDEYYF